ncbi:sensor histidine kinase [Lutibaculum baratangense]|uniref:sensor histidine kinase n=1 Tax=Lutibaculum baratangense TaxID=1358440 RepID=UPI00058D08AD|nr:HWE histidine kinase domain-containing protein [Lutibaculum baratangense]
MSDSRQQNDPVRVLLLEDSRQDYELIIAHLRRGGGVYEVTHTAGREEFERALDDGSFDLVLADYSLPSFDGRTALRLTRERRPDLPFILVSGVLGEEVAIDSINEGATDYVLKQRMDRLPSAVSRALAEANERKERRRAEEHLKLLVGELSHRVKNTLATVSSIAHQTLSRSATLEEFQEAFLGRLQVLSDAHDLLFQANWGRTDLRKVLERTLQPFEARPGIGLRLEGPSIMIPPRSAVTISLVLHELATNAAKYGALSSEGGYVHLGWDVTQQEDGSNLVSLKWRERDGPTVAPPTRRGFGRTLIERGAAYELDGTSRLSYHADGVACDISFPLR